MNKKNAIYACCNCGEKITDTKGRELCERYPKAILCLKCDADICGSHTESWIQGYYDAHSNRGYNPSDWDELDYATGYHACV